MSGVVTLVYDPSLRTGELRRLALEVRYSDPVYRAENAARLRQKRICLVCAMRTNMGALGVHQKASGHRGWV